jgi:hypothetical protein
MYGQALKRIAFACLLIIVALRATPAAADVTNGLRYSVPKGWSTSEMNGVRIVHPSTLDNGEMMLALLIGVQPAAGSPDEQIATIAATINTDVTVSSSSAILVTDRGDAGKIHIKNFDVTSKEMGRHGRMVALMIRGDQRGAIVFMITDNKVLQKYGDGMQELLKSFALDSKAVPAAAAKPTTEQAAPKATQTAAAEGHLPTGETPDLYPGSSGWLPSGRGVAIPVARVVKGKPEGLWWHFQSSGSKTKAVTTIFLADGTRATNPRPGSGLLFDLEGQRKAPGTTGVGTFSIEGGKITQTHDGFTQTDSFRSGSDKNGAWIEIGAGRHYPLVFTTAKDLVGTWKGTGQTFTFYADGALEGGGTWQLDGYLLAIRNPNGGSYITTVGRTGALLIIGSSSYSK